MRSLLFSIVLCSILLSCNKNETTTPQDSEPLAEAPDDNGTPKENNQNLLLQLQGTQLVDANKNPIYLQGVAFNNFIWENTALPPQHHTELDYKRVTDMGMNTIRFYMNYLYFEDDSNPYVYKQSGWDWLDENIAWAKKHGVYLVLNMHVPQGGYQSQGQGDALWDIVENQDRLASLWKQIAKRYVNEVQIAGFGPVNEPYPNSSINQWNQLAQKLINDIRSVNKNHLIFIEQAINVKGQQNIENLNFPVVSGTNLIYEFHGYNPYFYTHQLLEFAKLGEGGSYPDENKLEISNSEWYTTIFNNPTLSTGNTDWTYYQGERYEITDPKSKIAVPVLIGANIGSGKVYFDDITIKEYDTDGNYTKDILSLNPSSKNGWFFWSENATGKGELDTTEGHNDSNSLFITEATGNCTLSNTNLSFIPKQGYSYEVSGWMKGASAPSDNGASIRIDLYTTDGPVLTRNKAYLQSVLNNFVSWANQKNVALYMGEFGAGFPCFQDNKGGLQFVEDMVAIAKENDIHFTYHAYHEDAFGLYLGYGLPDPSNVNKPLIDWFTTNLN